MVGECVNAQTSGPPTLLSLREFMHLVSVSPRSFRFSAIPDHVFGEPPVRAR